MLRKWTCDRAWCSLVIIHVELHVSGSLLALTESCLAAYNQFGIYFLWQYSCGLHQRVTVSLNELLSLKVFQRSADSIGCWKCSVVPHTYADTKHTLAHPKQNAHAYIKACNYCKHERCPKITAYVDISLLRQHIPTIMGRYTWFGILYLGRN